MGASRRAAVRQLDLTVNHRQKDTERDRERSQRLALFDYPAGLMFSRIKASRSGPRGARVSGAAYAGHPRRRHPARRRRVAPPAWSVKWVAIARGRRKARRLRALGTLYI